MHQDLEKTAEAFVHASADDFPGIVQAAKRDVFKISEDDTYYGRVIVGGDTR